MTPAPARSPSKLMASGDKEDIGSVGFRNGSVWSTYWKLNPGLNNRRKKGIRMFGMVDKNDVVREHC